MVPADANASELERELIQIKSVEFYQTFGIRVWALPRTQGFASYPNATDGRWGSNLPVPGRGREGLESGAPGDRQRADGASPLR
jgi:hypothetical protein